MNLRQYLDEKVSQALSLTSGEKHCQGLIAPAKSAQFGDYQANGVMALAKRLGRNPQSLRRLSWRARASSISSLRLGSSRSS
jgi:arginyl-tRNA synthetase